MAAIHAGPSAEEPLTEVAVRPRAADVHVHFVALAWVPYVPAEGSRLTAAIA